MQTPRSLATRLSAILVPLALAGGPALAQDDAVIPEQDERETLTDDLIGMGVYTVRDQTDGREQIGTIESLLLNENHRLTGVVVSIGGFLGFGAKSVALDWEALQVEQIGETGFIANVDMTLQDLEDAPEFKTLERKRAEEAAEREREQLEQQQQEMQQGQTGTTQ